EDIRDVFIAKDLNWSEGAVRPAFSKEEDLGVINATTSNLDPSVGLEPFRK
ncbi:unnamed protein product, partial [Arabidopsis halleri]